MPLALSSLFVEVPHCLGFVLAANSKAKDVKTQIVITVSDYDITWHAFS